MIRTLGGASYLSIQNELEGLLPCFYSTVTSYIEHLHACTIPFLQSQHKSTGDPAPKFFEECETYWSPSSVANELYEQLASKKYREILRPQIQ